MCACGFGPGWSERVLGLVEAKFGAAGEGDGGDETEPGIGDRAAEFYAALFEIGNGGIDVVHSR